MKRLVIKHGDQILRHELGTLPVTVGRDPACELSFDDPSLSRRHGRFEVTTDGVRYVDLGSRNGSWVNTKKTKRAELKPGDAVRIGALRITYTYEPEPEEDENDSTATVIAPSARAQPESDKTVLLDRSEKDKAPASAPHAGTMLFRPEKAPPKGPPDTARLTPDKLAPARPQAHPQPQSPSVRAEVPPHPEAAGPEAENLPLPERWSWTAKQAFITLGVGLTLYIVLAFPLVRTLGNALREESLRRGRALLDVLASANGAAIAEGRVRDLEVDKVTRGERVKEGLLLDLQGKVLAPTSRVEETLATIPGIERPTTEIRTFYLGRRGDDYVMVEPVLDSGKRVGIAVLVYEVAAASGSWAVAVMFLGLLTLLLGVLVAMVLGKRWTLEPISALGDDVEAVVKGDASRIPVAQGFGELSELAKSINRLIDRAPMLSASLASSPVARLSGVSAPVVPPAPPVPRPSATPAPATPGSSAPGPEPAPAPRPVPVAGSEGGSTDAARFWVDSSFLVVRVEPEAASLLGESPEVMEGHHVIEAIKDQKVLGIVLDSLNALDSGTASPVAPAHELAGGTFAVTAAREGEWVVVSLKRAG